MQNWTQWKNPNQVGGKTIRIWQWTQTRIPSHSKILTLLLICTFHFNSFIKKEFENTFSLTPWLKNPRWVVSFETIVGG